MPNVLRITVKTASNVVREKRFGEHPRDVGAKVSGTDDANAHVSHP
jgi:hypothetical protein